jgi:SAM-dependent methyltransferase
MERIPCPLCGNTDLVQIAQRGQHGLPCLPSICPNDGLVFLTPRWSKARYAHFYEFEYDGYYRSGDLAGNPDETRYKPIQQICSRLQLHALLEGRTSALDVGAGMGWSLDWLRTHHPSIAHLYAIEPSQQCSSHLRDVLGVNVICDDVDSQWDHSGFDLVIMRHVLEHMLDPLRALSKVAQALTDKGIVYIAVPDMMHPRGLLEDYWFRCVHTFYFSAPTLTAICKQAGLEPIIASSENSELWAIFQRADGSVLHAAPDAELFRTQMRVINSHRRKSILLDVVRRARRMCKRAVGCK